MPSIPELWIHVGAEPAHGFNKPLWQISYWTSVADFIYLNSAIHAYTCRCLLKPYKKVFVIIWPYFGSISSVSLSARLRWLTAFCFLQVWAGPLNNKVMAVVMVNRNDKDSQTITVDFQEHLGWPAGTKAVPRDLWEHKVCLWKEVFGNLNVQCPKHHHGQKDLYSLLDIHKTSTLISSCGIENIKLNCTVMKRCVKSS